MNTNHKQYNWLPAYFFKLLALGFLLIIQPGCKKYLDEKPLPSLAVPKTLNDLQALLNNSTAVINGNSPAGFAEAIADNYYMITPFWQELANSGVDVNQSLTHNYIWESQALPYGPAWTFSYMRPIYYSNIVLDYLPKVETNPGDETKYNALKGAALFIRAFTFQQLAQLYARPYSAENGNTPGIVLKNRSDVSEKVTRATVEQTYQQIIADLKEAAELLPVTTPFKTQPSQAAAYGALARTYLSIRDYTNAGHYADLALRQYSILMDYNTLNPALAAPVSSYNPEIIYLEFGSGVVTINSSSVPIIDTVLYQSYNSNDLRKTIFFQTNKSGPPGSFFFRGSYNGSTSLYSVFTGLATDELYLIRAECAARAGEKDVALADLNALMSKRWKNTVPYSPMSAATAAEALVKILDERRKELVWRGLRWSDIRRLNLEDANITLKRIIAGITYTLPPNDLRAVMLIPYEEVTKSGIEQNPR